MSPTSRRPRHAERLDRVAVVLFLAIWTWALLRLAPSFLHSEARWPILLGVFVGYVLADFFSGAVHWIADRFFAPTTWLIGPLLIAPFRDHHADANEIARHDFFEISGNNALVSLPLAVAICFLPLPTAESSSPVGLALVHGLGLGLTLAVFLTNQLHGWAHQATPPAPIRRLQRWGWILSRERHDLHHRHHDRAYCVTSGWLNPLLDRIHFFPGLERGIEALRRSRRPRSRTR